MSIKIQLNSKEVFERLIGDNPEFELEIKRSIQAAYTNGVFKKKVEQAAKDFLIKEAIGSSWWYSSNIPDETKKKIKEVARDVIKEYVEVFIRQTFESIIKERVEQQVKELIEKEFIEMETINSIRIRAKHMVAQALENFKP